MSVLHLWHSVSCVLLYQVCGIRWQRDEEVVWTHIFSDHYLLTGGTSEANLAGLSAAVCQVVTWSDQALPLPFIAYNFILVLSKARTEKCHSIFG